MQEEALDRKTERVLTRLRTLREATNASSDDHLARERLLGELAEALEELEISYEELHSQNEELHAAQAALERERRRYGELFDLAPDGYLVTDDEGVITNANRSAATLLNVPPQHLIGKPMVVFVVEADRQAFHSRLTHVRNGNRIRNWRVRLQPRHNASIVTVIAASPADEGTLTQLRWLFRDITEVARAEEMTKKHRERLAGILNSAMDAVITINEDQRITLFNPAAERIFQYDTAQVLGRPLDLLLPERFQKKHRQHIRRFGRTDVTSRTMGEAGTVYGRRADGEEFPIEASISQVKSDGETFYTVILRDITERVESEQRLRRHTRELEALAQVADVMRRAETRTEMVPRFIAKTIDVFQADAGALVTRQDNGFVSIGLGAGDPIESPRRHRYPTDAIPLWQTLSPDEPVFVAETCEHTILARCELWKTEMAEMSAGAMIALHGAAETSALLVLGYRSDHHFTSEKKRLLSAVADMAGNALRRLNLLETLEQRVTDRTRELSTLYEVSALASQSLDLETVLAQSLEGTLSALGATMGTVHLLDEDEKELHLAHYQGMPADLASELEALSSDEDLPAHVMSQGKAIVIPDLASDPRVPEFVRMPRSWIGVPMRARGRTLGVLGVVGAEEQKFSVEEVALLSSMWDQIAIAVENARLHRQAKQTAIIRERRRVARELHDSVSQHLYGLRLYADTVQEQLKAGNLEEVHATVSQFDQTLQETFAEMRLLVHELRPSALEQNTLTEALQDRLNFVEERMGLQVDLQTEDGIDPLPGDVEQVFYRIAQEALNNVIRHAQASAVTVRLPDAGDEIVLQITDDGVGFVPSEVQEKGGMGIASMRERVQDVGGTLEIESAPGAGTTVTVRAPR